MGGMGRSYSAHYPFGKEIGMKRIFSIILAVALVFTMCTGLVAYADQTENSITFTDVDANTTRGAAIYKMANAGILVGDGNGIFRPNDPITRGELTKIVNMIFGYTEKDTTTFTDVNDSHWYKDNVLIAQKAGYIKGYEDGTFRGDNYITREETCTILTRVADVPDLGYRPVISDEVSDWAKPYVERVVGSFFMTLEEGNKFRATENITRAEFCEAFAKFVVERPVITPDDKQEEDKKEDNKEEDKEDKKPSTGTGSGSGSGNTSKPIVINPMPEWESGNLGTDEPDDEEENNNGEVAGDGNAEQLPEDTDYADENAEIIGHLETVLEFLGNMDIGSADEDAIVSLVYDSISLVIDDASDDVLIDSDFVADRCMAEMDEVVSVYRGMSDDEKDTFKEKFTYGDGDDTIAFNTLMNLFSPLKELF